MRKFLVSKLQNGKHVVRNVAEAFPMLKTSDINKALKHRDIRVDGKRISSDISVYEGQEIQVWLPDSLFEKEIEKKESSTKRDSDYKIVAETDGLLIVNKRQGLAVHGGANVDNESLIDILRRDTGNGELDLVHRIDMNTGGILMLAKDKRSLNDAIKLFKQDLLFKRYRCLVIGVPGEGEPVVCHDETLMKEVTHFLEKTPSGNVYIHDDRKAMDLPITSRYHVVNIYKGKGPDNTDVSELEVELVTGRTHQIRAQFAHMGYPIIGDGNYGRNKQNMFFRNLNGGKVNYQQLFATGLLLGRIPPDNVHSALSGRKFEIVPRYDVKL